MVYERVRNEGIDQFCNLDVQFVWNFSTWLRIILNLAKDVNTDPSTQDCLLSKSNFTRMGHTVLTSFVGRYQFVDTKAHSSLLGNVKFRGKYASKNFFAARLVCALNKGCPKQGKEASHLCANNPQLCIKSEHFLWESKQVNLSRTGCQTFGSGYYCNHRIKCVYTDKKGRWLPCRNSEESPLCTCENEYCRFADILKPG